MKGIALKQLLIRASNVFGIGHLEYRFDLSRQSCVAIYAPNGTCKTSLRKAINDWSKGKPARDAFFPERTSSFEFVTEPADGINPANVFCFRSMGDLASARFFDDALLASPELKAKYIKDQESHVAELKNLLKMLRSEIVDGSGSPKDDEMGSFITGVVGASDLGDALAQLVERAESPGEPRYVTEHRLSDVLSKSVENALAKPGVKEAFVDYAKVRDKVLSKSVYFGDGFDYLGATALAAELEKSKFFEAGHSLTLRNREDGSERVIASCEAFRAAVDGEIRRADSDPVVVGHFKTADEKLGKVAAVKKFKDLIGDDSELASAVGDPAGVKLTYLVHAVRLHKEEVERYLADRESYLQRMAGFQKELSEERSDWDDAVQTFQNRFQLPVRPYVRNRPNVVLGSSEPVIAFKYQGTDVDNDVLMENLSEGEKKALYMLSVIFEVERSKRLEGPKLYVFDDVVDSFDYVNKYAFIEYLRDFVDSDDAYAILLTHNFDFFRTVASRLGSDFGRQNCLVAEKEATGIVELKRADFIKKTPLVIWKNELENNAVRIASIAMVRELVEMRDGDQDADYALLSSVLHGRPNGRGVTFDDLSGCYMKQIGCDALAGDERKVQTVLIDTCNQIVNNTESLVLHDKIVLSIGIRTLVERYIHAAFALHGIESSGVNTLGRLISEFKKKLPGEYSIQADCMDQATLIVPENIHVNGFMYEPLVDIGSQRFVSLYRACLSL